MGRKRAKNLHLPPGVRIVKGRYYHQTTAGGKRISTPLGKTYSEAIARWTALAAPLHGSTVGHAIDRYILDILPQKAPRTQNDYIQYTIPLRRVFGHMGLSEVRPTHIAQYLDKSKGKKLANRQIALLSGVYKAAMRWGWVDTNPCKGVQRNPEKRRNRYVSQDELETLKSAGDEQMKLLIEFAYITGLRKGDILNLTLADVSAEGISVQTGKTGKRLVFEMSPGLRKLLPQIKALPRKARSIMLFARRDGRAYTSSGFDSIWQRLKSRAGVDVTFHDIRGTAITDAKRKAGLDYAQSLAGHDSRDTTEGYVRARDVEKVRPLK